MTRSLTVALVVISIVLTGCATEPADRVVVAAGTTLVDSGFMAELVGAFESQHPGVDLAVVGLSSAEALAYADAGNADITITHTKQALHDYLQMHPEAVSLEPFSSSFFIVADPGLDITSASIVEVLGDVAARGLPFVSRDDGSGTHAAELAAWKAARIEPFDMSWYVRTGSGMGATLQVADQRAGVTLAEHGAYVAARGALTVEPVPGTELPNHYDLMIVDQTQVPRALEFAEWLVSEPGVSAIAEANTELFGEQIYIAP